MLDSLLGVLLGRDRATTLRFLAVGVGLIVVETVLLVIGATVLGGVALVLVLVVAVVGGCGATALYAYRNDGLVPSWIVAGLAGVPLTFPFAFARVHPYPPSVVDRLLGIVYYAGWLGLLVGTIGFAVGILAQHVLRRKAD